MDEIEKREGEVARHPQDGEAYKNLGNAYYDKRDYCRAIEYFEKAIVLNPNDAMAYCTMGIAYAYKRYSVGMMARVLRIRTAYSKAKKDITALPVWTWSYKNKVFLSHPAP